MGKVYGSKRNVWIFSAIFLVALLLTVHNPKEISLWFCVVLFGLLDGLFIGMVFVPLFTFDEKGIYPGHLVLWGRENFIEWSRIQRIDNAFAARKYSGYVIRTTGKFVLAVQRYSYSQEDIDTLSAIIHKAKTHNPALFVSPGLLAKAGLSENFARGGPEPSTSAAEVKTIHSSPVVTYCLLAALTGIFILEMIFKLDPSHAALSIGRSSYLAFGGVSRSLVVGHGDWFRLVTAIFLHADIGHLLGNGVALYFAGAFLEEYFGRAIFFSLFAIGGLAGTLASITLNSGDIVSIGASGAIMALLAADFVLSFHLSRGAAKTRIQYLTLRIIIPSLLPQINHGGAHVDISAHLGGAVAGALAGLVLLAFWQKGSPTPPFSGLAKAFCPLAIFIFCGAIFCQAKIYGMSRQVLRGDIADEKSLSDTLDSETLFSLGFNYHWGKGVPKDDAKAFKLYQASADMGNSEAQASLGYLYQSGSGTGKNIPLAIALYRKSADQGNRIGEFFLAYAYETGTGVPRNYTLALKWYKPSADAGNMDSQNNLGIMYRNGMGVPRDYDQAAGWIRKAAEGGDPVGENNLGDLCEKGLGVSRDKVEALKWYRKAAAKGFEPAKKNLARLDSNQ